jgi:hypothetical protein
MAPGDAPQNFRGINHVFMLMLVEQGQDLNHRTHRNV